MSVPSAWRAVKRRSRLCMSAQRRAEDRSRRAADVIPAPDPGRRGDAGLVPACVAPRELGDVGARAGRASNIEAIRQLSRFVVTNEWTCLPGVPGYPHDEPGCFDPVFMQWMKDSLAGREPHIATVGIAYMYVGAWVPNISRNGAGSDDFHVGPHIMIVSPHENQKELAAISHDGSTGMPYVAHLPHGEGSVPRTAFPPVGRKVIGRRQLSVGAAKKIPIDPKVRRPSGPPMR